MIYTTILLPDWLERIIRALTIIPILITELLYFLLTPFIWLKFKFHIALFVICVGLGCYWYFTDKKHAIIMAASTFVLITTFIAIIKWLRKRLKKIDESLLHYFHLYPLARVEINIPIINKKYFEERKHEKENQNRYINPDHYYCSCIMRDDSDNSDNPS